MRTISMGLALAAVLALGLVAGGPIARAIPESPSEGPPGVVLDLVADRLGIDAARRAEIRALLAARFDETRALRDERERVRERLREILSRPDPHRAEALDDVDTLSAIEAELRRVRLGVLLDVRALLTPAERVELVAIREEVLGTLAGSVAPGLSGIEVACAPEAETLCEGRGLGTGLVLCLVQERDGLSTRCARALEELPGGF